MELIKKEIKNKNDYVKAIKLFIDKKYKESIESSLNATPSPRLTF